MFVTTLESLVLRGVSVLGGGQTVNPRLDAGSADMLQQPTISHPMPHSMPIRACEERAMGAPSGSYLRLPPGTGRSLGHAGGLSKRSSLATSTRSSFTGAWTSQPACPARCLVPGNGLAGTAARKS